MWNCQCTGVSSDMERASTTSTPARAAGTSARHQRRPRAIAAVLVLLVLAAQMPHTSAHGNDSKGASAAKEPVPLALPKDPDVTCSKSVFLEMTATYSCPWGGYPAHNPDHGCCEGLQTYFGIKATKPSKHCLCVEEVWSRLNKGEEYHRIPFTRIFKFCNHKGYIIPFYQEGNGYCNGTQDDPYKPADYEARYIPDKQLPSVNNWASRLDKNWLMHLSFISSVASVPGFVAFLWPYVFDAYFTAKDALSKKRQ